MDDTNQIEPPPSFTAIYLAANGASLTHPAKLVIGRYELCEDLAQSLAERAAEVLSTTQGGESKYAAAIGEALVNGGPVSHAEADWIVTRVAELAGWDSSAMT